MTRTIYKYVLDPKIRGGDYLFAEVALPLSAQILHVDVQRGGPYDRENICVWASVLKGEERYRNAGFAIVPTGGTIPEAMSPKHLGTVLMESGTLVFHVFKL